MNGVYCCLYRCTDCALYYVHGGCATADVVAINRQFTGKQNEIWLRKWARETNNNEGSIRRNGHNATAPRNVPSLDVKEIGAPRGERIQRPGSSTAAVHGSQTNHESSGSDPSAISLDTEKTLAQVPTAAAATQSPAGRQRLEELAIIQSRQLIPVTPSLPKTLVRAAMTYMTL